MDKTVAIIGAGLAGSEAALQLANRSVQVSLFEARPSRQSPVHTSSLCAELVCSNSFKSEKDDSAAGLLKHELGTLHSALYALALTTRVPAGGSLAVDRVAFAQGVTLLIEQHPAINLIREEVIALSPGGILDTAAGAHHGPFDAVVIATGPLTTDAFSSWLAGALGQDSLSFYDAAAPIVFADSLNMSKLFSQSRYEPGSGDYLNAPLTQDEYAHFAAELINAKRVIAKDFETQDLFQACQPIEEIARKSIDAPRYGALKPVGLHDPRTGKRPWAVVQLRKEDAHSQSYNLVGFQTNLTFPEQERVFRLIPGLEQAQFARYGVMHRNTFLNAPRCMNASQTLQLVRQPSAPLMLAGQISGTEGYCEAIRSGLQAALELSLIFAGAKHIPLPEETVYGSLLAYATNPQTQDYQPMHVNFGIMKPLESKVKNKGARYRAYANRAHEALGAYIDKLHTQGVL